MIIKGKDLSASIKEALKVRVEVLKNQYGRTPNLVVVLVGDDPGSVSYVTGKAKAATEVGIANNTIRLDIIENDAKLSDIEKNIHQAYILIDRLSTDHTQESISRLSDSADTAFYEGDL